MSIADMGTQTRNLPPVVEHPVNLRITIPFLPRSFFITLIIGPEKRGRERRRQERQRHPISTWGNLTTVITLSGMFLTAALFVALVIDAL